jgi:tRNA(Ile)-lysidine synthase
LKAAAARNGANRIATGHHADDRAETVVMRLMRGGGHVRNLAVLAPRSGDRIRPMIRARRADIDAHIARHGIPTALDPSNADPRFLRVRIRNEVLPVLERLSPRIVEHLCALADDAGTDHG